MSFLKELPAGRRRTVTFVASVAIGALLVTAASNGLGLGVDALDGYLSPAVQSVGYAMAAALCLLRAAWVEEHRGPWIAIGAGIALWWPAVTLFHFWIARAEEPPFPSIADGLWLLSYLPFYTGLMLLTRRQLRQPHASVWLDGLIGAAALASLAAAIVFDAVLEASHGASAAAIATRLAYPLGDMILLALIAGVFAIGGWRPGGSWKFLLGGLTLLLVAHSVFLYKVAQGGYEVGDWVEVLFLAATLVIARAAWQPARASQRVRLSGTQALVFPSFFVVIALGLLVAGQYGRGLNLLALLLAVQTLALAMTRAVLTVRELDRLSDSHRLSMTDELTGLGNRRALYRDLGNAFARAEAAGRTVALLCVDLDRFKELNDTLGHHVGDVLLEQVGPRLNAVLRDADGIARLGGDEFAAVVVGISVEQAVAVAERVRRALRRPFLLDELSVPIDASVGVAVYPTHAGDAATLLRRADAALYDAKRARLGCAVYNEARDGHDRDRFGLAGELRRALSEGQLVVYYQPKLRVATGEPTGVEALVRWRHPTRGLLSPGQFLPVAEQTTMMRDLTRFVVTEAIRQSGEWRDRGLELSMAINLSATDLVDLGFPDELVALADAAGVPTSMIEFEVTESILIGDPSRATRILERLNELGFRTALDDFGTGYSSLAHLRDLRLSDLKIDRSFVANMSDDLTDAAIVRATINLAHSLGLGVVAEGVEAEPAWKRLAELGCDAAQGYYLSEPLPPDAISAWIGTHQRSRGAKPAAA